MQYGEALKAASNRGHNLSGFTESVKEAGSLANGWEATCTRCGMAADVWSHGGVTGEAVALNCGDAS